MGIVAGAQVQALDDAGKVESVESDPFKNDGCSCLCLSWSFRSSSSRGKVENPSMAVPNSAAAGQSPSGTCIDNKESCKMAPSEEPITSGEDDVSVSGKAEEELALPSHLRKFSFNDLKSATRNFRPDSLLGEGGFGQVFKGWIDKHGTAPVKPGTGLTVAVKTLNHSGLQGHKEWLAELNFLGQLHHPNLVKLVGYCIEDDQRLLVYEFMERGSLENHLFPKGALPLPWVTRMKIALGAAKGLAFLHAGKRPVIYRDFKTSNILLDAEYNAKLSDFGLAKAGPEDDKSHVSTCVMGTYGYAAPDYVMTGHLTTKSDVYSFGVVLLETLTGRCSVDQSRPSGEHNLVVWARPYLSDKKKVFKVIDPRLEGHFSIKGVQKAAGLVESCLSRDPKARPLMTDVVDALGAVQHMKDMANASYQFQAVTIDCAGQRLPACGTGNFQQLGRNGHVGYLCQKLTRQCGRA